MSTLGLENVESLAVILMYIVQVHGVQGAERAKCKIMKLGILFLQNENKVRKKYRNGIFTLGFFENLQKF